MTMRANIGDDGETRLLNERRMAAELGRARRKIKKAWFWAVNPADADELREAMARLQARYEIVVTELQWIHERHGHFQTADILRMLAEEVPQPNPDGYRTLNRWLRKKLARGVGK